MSHEFIEHTADIKFRVKTKTMEELFIEAAEALNEIIRGNITILEKQEKEIEVQGTDLEVLLYNFLEEFLFMLEAEEFLAANIKEINYNPETLSIKAKITGDNAQHYKFTNDVKAITFNDMYIKREDQTCQCQVVLDV